MQTAERDFRMAQQANLHNVYFDYAWLICSNLCKRYRKQICIGGDELMIVKRW